MSCHSSILALLTLSILYLTAYTTHAAHIAIQPPAISSLHHQGGRGAPTLPTGNCDASRYECPASGNSIEDADVLVVCSMSQNGKLQCVYGDLTTESKPDQVIGGVASGAGLGALPTTDICTYDLVSLLHSFSPTLH